jgi:hypothetical protein
MNPEAMSPEIQQLGIHLSELVIRNSATTIYNKVTATKARKNDKDTIAELEQIVRDLIADNNELVQIAQAYEQELIAQRISASEIEYITENVLPVLETLIEAAPDDGDSANSQRMLDLLRPLLSIETVTIMQLIGFNFRQAIGQPLTTLVSQLILSKVQADPSAATELQRVNALMNIEFFKIAQDPDATARLNALNGRQ